MHLLCTSKWLMWRNGHGVAHINKLKLYVEPG